MFDFNKLGDLSKMASSAKLIQEKQELAQQEQTQVLREISSQLQELINLVKAKG